MRLAHLTFAAGLVALAAATPSTAGAQQSRASSARQASYAVAPSDSGYSSRESDFVLGKRIYLRSTKTFIGTIIDMEDSHGFPPERFPHARMKAVFVVRRDGPREWVPVEGITRLYVVK